MRLSPATLALLPPSVVRPAFDPRALGVGIVHLGVGNFHRAHQAVYTEDAIARAGGHWGILGVSLRRPDMADALAPQDDLYTLETLGDERRYRVMGVLRGVLVASRDGERLLHALAAPTTHVVTLTVTEKGYCLAGDGTLDFAHPDIAHDLAAPSEPRSTIGWIVRGLSGRKRAGAGPLTLVSCDNLSANGRKLEDAVTAFADKAEPSLTPWITDNVAFPETMVDCIVPATDAAAIARAEKATGLRDASPVTREAFAQWVIEDKFAGPRPAWDEVGVEIVADVAPFERLKLHVLNASHSALAYLGLPRGHTYVRQAISDPELARFLDGYIADEVAPALAPIEVTGYWRAVKQRFANPNLDHRLAQIAEDGSIKLAQRVFPILVANARAGRPHARAARIVRAWLAFASRGSVKDPMSARLASWAKDGARIESVLDDPTLFPDAFRTEPSVRSAILSAQP